MLSGAFSAFSASVRKGWPRRWVLGQRRDWRRGRTCRVGALHNHVEVIAHQPAGNAPAKPSSDTPPPASSENPAGPHYPERCPRAGLLDSSRGTSPPDTPPAIAVAWDFDTQLRPLCHPPASSMRKRSRQNEPCYGLTRSPFSGRSHRYTPGAGSFRARRQDSWRPPCCAAPAQSRRGWRARCPPPHRMARGSAQGCPGRRRCPGQVPAARRGW